MMEHWQYWLAIGWVACGFLAYGHTLAHFQRKWPSCADGDRAADIYKACLMGAFGPIGLLVSILHGRHGFMWRLPPRKEG